MVVSDESSPEKGGEGFGRFRLYEWDREWGFVDLEIWMVVSDGGQGLCEWTQNFFS